MTAGPYPTKQMFKRLEQRVGGPLFLGGGRPQRPRHRGLPQPAART